ncbi:MAG: isoprenylcysteine carboxylmethyltransferase family protein [Deltaproteobacteria bacterium]|nr:isoprenylcysteine carboxylmethyltransferase family protein [Deltaproteobacteria bacterium]
MSWNLRLFEKYRTGISRIVAVFLFLILIFTRTRIESDLAKAVLNNAGLFLITLCVFGRLWSSLYICGKKTTMIVKDGPYSVVRNPLYLCSYLGVLGISLSTENLFLIILLNAAFLFYYPFVIISEERKLTEMHGESFTHYMQQTPRIIPNFFKLTQPETYEVHVRIFNNALSDAIWFYIAYIAIDFIKLIQSKGIISFVINM